ncbi:ABC transporter permease [Shinella sp.]|uniref:ABC transporter permease n=1 Tax=Shinella sp. TaxID=1870904 RepID=UPI003F6FAE0E
MTSTSNHVDIGQSKKLAWLMSPTYQQNGFKETFGRWLPTIFTILLSCLLLSPVVPIVYQAFLDKPIYDATGQLSFGNFVRMFQDEAFLPALVNTFYFAVISTAISLGLGLFFSLSLDRLELPFRRTLRILVLSPMFISPLILAFAWSMLYGKGGFISVVLLAYFKLGLPNLNSMGGMCLIAGIVQAPISYLYISAAAASIPDTLERSARASGASPLMSLVTIVLPLLKPSLLYCALLNCMIVVDLLGVPLIIGEPAGILVLSTFLYTKGAISVQMDYGVIAAGGLLTIFLVQAIILLQGRLIGDRRKYVTISGHAARTSRMRAGRTGWILSGIILAFSLIFVIAPTFFLILRSFTTILSPLLPVSSVLTLNNYWDILRYEQYVRSIGNSLLISSVGGAMAVALTFITVVFAYRTSPTVRRVIEQVSMVPRAIPGMIVGVGIFYGMLLMPGGEYLRNTLIILAIAFTIRNFPTGFGAISPAFAQIGADLDRAARVCGSSKWRAVKDITLPLMKGTLLGAFLLYFINFFKEYSTASFLFGPGTEVIGTTMLQLNYKGYLGTLAALAVIELLILIPIAVVIYARR